MIAVSIMIRTANASIHWSLLFKGNDFGTVRSYIASAMPELYPDLAYSVHMTRGDGAVERDEVGQIPFIEYLN